MTTYNILRAVPLIERVSTAKSLEAVFPEIHEVADFIEREIESFKTNLYNNVLESTTNLFNKAKIPCIQEFQNGNLKIIKIPDVLEVPGLYDTGFSFYKTRMLHVEKTYTTDDFLITFGLIIDEEKIILTGKCECESSNELIYEGRRIFKDVSQDTLSYPPNTPIKIERYGHSSSRAIFEDGSLVDYCNWHMDDWCDSTVCISFRTSDVMQWITEILSKS